MTVTVEATDIHVKFGTATIVDSVSVRADIGSWLSIIGPNGAGKTTLLRAMLGLVPCSGQVTVDGSSMTDLDPRRRAQLMALVPQQPELPPAMRVTDYVLLGRTPHLSPLGREGPADLDVVGEVLERLDLLDLADRRLANLSGGERQRTVIARAMAQQAPVLMLDEPTTALDLGHQHDVLELVDELRRTQGITVISTMHDLTVAADHADRLVLLADGEIVRQGTPEQVLDAVILEEVYGTAVDIVIHEGRRIVLPRRAGATQTEDQR